MAASGSSDSPAGNGNLRLDKRALAGLGADVTEEEIQRLEELFKTAPYRIQESLKPDLPPSALRSVVYVLIHSWRTLGYVPPLLLLGGKCPKAFVALVASYLIARLQDRWKNAIHDFTRFGSSNRPRFVSAQREPYDRNKQYMITLHPHGILCCAWFNLIARHAKLDDKNNFSTQFYMLDGIQTVLHFAPAVQFYPLHGEMYRDKCTDVTPRSLKQSLRNKMSVALSPGGFSEAVYTGWSDEYDCAYIDERYGFIKLAIQHGIDIIPTYSFGLADMYKTIQWKAHERAKKAQELGVPMVLWWGKCGTNVPLTEDTCTVSFEPFPTSRYTVDQVVQCHADYCEYLKSCFMRYRHTSPHTKNKELVIIGKNKPPPPPRREGHPRPHARSKL